ncbi:MAG: hypothetical protein MUE70_01615 [Desulfobacterales bacterium]|jgi:hypothetical protein|nr:hypothetical protein [Desulfobacterales bacterium]
MAKAEKTKKTKAAGTENSLAKTFQKVSETVTEKVKDYNEKYLSKAIDKSKETVKEYNEKYLAKAIEKGKDAYKEYNDKYISKAIEDAKDYFDKPYKKAADALDEALKKGRKIEKDTYKKLDKYIQRGRKFMYKVPMVETIEKTMTDGLNAVPGLINMPTKGEIEKLTLAMEALNTNIESLKKQHIL